MHVVGASLYKGGEGQREYSRLKEGLGKNGQILSAP